MVRKFIEWLKSLWAPRKATREKSVPQGAPSVALPAPLPTPELEVELPPQAEETQRPTQLPVGTDAIHTLWTYVTRPTRFARKVDPKFIAETLESIDSAFIVELDGQMRKPGPFASTWHGAESMSDLDELALPEATKHVLSAMHPSGRVRQAALDAIHKYKDPSVKSTKPSRHVLSCVLLRSNDWVDEVRDVACEIIDDMIVDASVEQWGDSFPSLYRLRFAKRHSHEDLYRESTNRLVRAPASRTMLRHIEVAPGPVARAAMELRLHANTKDLTAVMDAAMARRESKLRRAAVQLGNDVLPNTDALALLDRAERDSCPVVRMTSLDLRCKRLSVKKARPSLQRLLVDPSSRVRGYCQRILSDLGSEDIAEHYRTAVEQGKTANDVSSALMGLSEVGTASDVAFLLPRTKDSRARVRASAMTAMGELDPQSSSELLMEGLGDSSPRVSRAALRILRTHPRMIPTSRVRRLIRSSSDQHIRRNALDALLAKGNWAPLASLIECAADTDNVKGKTWVSSRFKAWRVQHGSWTEAPQRDVETDFTKAFETYASQLDPTMRREVSFLLDALDSRRYIE